MKQAVAERADIAFYIKMFPLMSIHPEAYKKAKTIMCQESDEKALALLEAAFEKKPLPEASCETDAVDKSIKLAESFGINGTPTIVFENGSKTSGVVKAADLIRMIANSP